MRATDPAAAVAAFRAALAGVTLPAQVTTPYGEDVDVARVLRWLEGWDQPTLYAMAAVLQACRESQP